MTTLPPPPPPPPPHPTHTTSLLEDSPPPPIPQSKLNESMEISALIESKNENFVSLSDIASCDSSETPTCDTLLMKESSVNDSISGVIEKGHIGGDEKGSLVCKRKMEDIDAVFQFAGSSGDDNNRQGYSEPPLKKCG